MLLIEDQSPVFIEIQERWGKDAEGNVYRYHTSPNGIMLQKTPYKDIPFKVISLSAVKI